MAERLALVKSIIWGWSWTAAAVATMWGALGVLAWMAWGPVPQPIVFTGKVSIYPHTINPGGVVVVTREFNVREPVALVVTRNLVPIGLPKRPVYWLSESRTLWKPGHYDNPRSHEIPEYIIPGKYRMELVASWSVNFLRHEVRELVPVEFDVVAR